MLLGGASLITLTACDEATDPLKEAKLFINQQQCEQQFTSAECSTAQRDSRAAHVAGAPRFANKAQCEAEFGAGNCEPVQTSSSTSSSHTTSSSRTTSGSSSSTPMSDSAMNTARGSGDGGSSGVGMFIPAMVGYMLGRQMGGGASFASAPVYRDTQNTAYAGNKPVGRLDSATMPPPSKVAGTAGTPSRSTLASATSTATSRGGFGATASRSSSGSSSS